MGVIRKLRRSIKRDGVLEAIKLCVKNLRPVKRDESRSDFDTSYAVDTDGTVELGDLKIDSPSDVWGIAYAPTPARVFERILGLLPAPHLYTFIDLGSGKGRVVLMAARHPFKAVAGVEFSRELCHIAEANLAAFRHHIVACNVKIVCQDAALFEYPTGPVIVYCYFAFTREVMLRVVELLSNRQDETIFVYYNSHYEELFAGWDILHREDVLCIWRLSGVRTS